MEDDFLFFLANNISKADIKSHLVKDNKTY